MFIIKKNFFFKKKNYLINIPISRKKLTAKKSTDSGRFKEQFSDNKYEFSDIVYSTDSLNIYILRYQFYLSNSKF